MSINYYNLSKNCLLGLFLELGEGDSLWSALAEYLGPKTAASSLGSGGGIG